MLEKKINFNNILWEWYVIKIYGTVRGPQNVGEISGVIYQMRTEWNLVFELQL